MACPYSVVTLILHDFICIHDAGEFLLIFISERLECSSYFRLTIYCLGKGFPKMVTSGEWGAVCPCYGMDLMNPHNQKCSQPNKKGDQG